MIQPLKWHGGKHYLAKRIIDLFPPHVHYVEPLFGGGSVLFQKPAKWVEGFSEVVNDIDFRLTNFWRVLAHDGMFDSFVRIVEATPFSQSDWRGAYTVDMDDTNAYPVEAAVNFFIRYRQSRQGLGKDFATLSRNRTRRGMNEQVSSWLSAVEGLPEAHERLKRVVILNDDACKVIRQQDGPNTLFYCDPPYLHETRTATDCYRHEMSANQHGELLEALGRAKARFILSGYRSDLYDDWASGCGWRRVDIAIDNKASSAKTKEVKTECLWMNY